MPIRGLLKPFQPDMHITSGGERILPSHEYPASPHAWKTIFLPESVASEPYMPSISDIHLDFLRLMLSSAVSLLKAIVWAGRLSKSLFFAVLMLISANVFPSISVMDNGITPQILQNMKSTSFEENRYFCMCSISLMLTDNFPPGSDVYVAPCFVQKEQLQIRIESFSSGWSTL